MGEASGEKTHHTHMEKAVEVATQDVRALIQRCVRGEPEAQMAFQEAYGPLIYSFPVRILP